MKLKLEFQYFENCPHYKQMFDNLSEAIKGLEDKIELIKYPVEDKETAKKISFRGSPTLLINGEDIEGSAAPDEPALACRFYANGIPSAVKIRQLIIQRLNIEK